MLGIVKYNFAHLLDFSGRDARPTFWYYVLFLFLLNIALAMVLGFVAVGQLVSGAVTAGQSGASEEAVQASMASGIGGMMGSIMWYSLVSNILMIVLLAASFVRRLHDSGKSGWWGLLVLAAQVVGFVVSLQTMDQMQDFMAQVFSQPGEMTPEAMERLMDSQRQMSAYSAVGWIGPLIAILFGVMDSTDGPNRYGEEPVRFDSRPRVAPPQQRHPGPTLTGPAPSPPDTRRD